MKYKRKNKRKLLTHNTMKMKNIMRLFLVLALFSIISCGQRDPNKHIDEGNVKGEIYTSEEMGWTIEIPKGWTVVSKDKLEALEEKGEKAIAEVAGEIDFSEIKHLISFQKGQFNFFQSTSESMPLEYEGEWENNHAGLKELLYETYTNQGIKLDTSSSKALLDDFEFEVFKLTIYDQTGKVILYQEMYSRYINGSDFGVNINYNNDKDRDTMMKALKNSKFKKG